MGKMLKKSMCSPEGSLVRMSASPEEGPGSGPEPDRGCGSSSRGLLASFDPVTCSLRMCPDYFDRGSGKSSRNWPQSGMMRSGRCFRLPNSAPRMCGNGFSYLPTPTVVGMTTNLSMGGYMRSGETWTSSTNLMSVLIGAEYGLTGRDPRPGGRHFPDPGFIEWVMGLPIGWTDVNASVTASRRTRPTTWGV